MAEVAADQIGSPDQALDALGRALKEEPMPGAALDDLERIAGAAKLPAAGAAKIEAAHRRRGSGLRRASWRCGPPGCTSRRGDAAAAERLYQKVLEGDEENVDALQALEALYRAAGDEQRLAAILTKRAEAELDPQARRTRLMEAARLHERRGAAGVGDAIAALQKLRAEDEGDAEALAELSRLHEAAGQRAGDGGGAGERARITEDPRARAALVVARRRAAPRHAATIWTARRRRTARRWTARPTIRSRCRRWSRSRSAARTGRRCRRC